MRWASCNILLREQFFHTRQSVDFGHRLIGSCAKNPRKAQRETTLVPAGSLYVIESDFDHQPGFDNSTKSLIFERVFQEKFRVFRDFGVREAGIGFSDVSQLLAVANCKGHVGEHMVPLAMAILRSCDHYVQRGVRFFQLYPRAPSTSRRVE